jgi:hypothetical protein
VEISARDKLKQIPDRRRLRRSASINRANVRQTKAVIWRIMALGDQSSAKRQWRGGNASRRQ